LASSFTVFETFLELKPRKSLSISLSLSLSKPTESSFTHQIFNQEYYKNPKKGRIKAKFLNHVGKCLHCPTQKESGACEICELLE